MSHITHIVNSATENNLARYTSTSSCLIICVLKSITNKHKAFRIYSFLYDSLLL